MALFVSDVWHRRVPAGEGDAGRFFLQVHYARHDIAQRVKPTAEVNHLDAAAAARLGGERERRLFGLRPSGFYDGLGERCHTRLGSGARVVALGWPDDWQARHRERGRW